ncbi:uncharacterized protein LOC107818090 [Nicotiana tabacum]|uniref:Uncharacterized protein n=1 Tax=Nicotiana tabacum TaxID=4097 RepID=A0A1S4CEC7_TOBAC|nr:PREDICTED: uncharacterized protein LOC107818090 [Nicotiana tabacum]XP_016499511.1 PREDICTED: uncharacterized protein LOC107818090 [Nicotiana tabacum]
MDFFKVKKFRKAHKPEPVADTEDKHVPLPGEQKNENGNVGKSAYVDTTNAEPEDDDDDFITNEVKRRLKELRRNSFMVLIPEESAPEDEEADDEEEQTNMNPGDWRDVEAEGRQFWSGFNAVYDKYSEQMLFYDRLHAQQLREFGSHIPTTSSPRSASKKLVSPFRCLSLKKMDESQDETEHLHQPVAELYQDLETAYVAQLCLTWEVLHCQHTQLSQKISCQPESAISYNHSAQQFQQFLVLLQRFIENEPFEPGMRPEIYARMRKALPMLLQVPKVQGFDQQKLEDDELPVLAPDLLKVIESSILTFRLFVKMDKKSGSVRNLFGSQNQMSTPLHQIQCSLEKKKVKLKELRKRKKNLKKKSWPTVPGDVDLLLGLIDVKVMNRVLRMERISKEQLFWCEEKMKKLDINDGKLQRDPSIILFPC